MKLPFSLNKINLEFIYHFNFIITRKYKRTNDAIA